MARLIRAGLAFVALMGACSAALAEPVTAILGYTLFAVGTTSITVGMVITALSVAASVYGSVQAKKRARQQQQRLAAEALARLKDRTANIVESDSPPVTVYGSPAPIGGSVVAVFKSGEFDQYKHYILIVAGHECAAVTDIFINGENIGGRDANGYATDLRWKLDEGVPEKVVATFDLVDHVWYDNEGTPNTFTDGYWSFPIGYDLKGFSVESIVDMQGKPLAGVTVDQLPNSFGGRALRGPKGTKGIVTYWKDGKGSALNIQVHLSPGGVDTADAFFRRARPDLWTEDHKLSGYTYLAITLNLLLDEFQGGLPEVTVALNGKKIYDPRTGLTEASHNPALALYDFLRSEVGYLASEAQINQNDLIAAANACDVNVYDPFLVATQGTTYGGSRQRYQCDGVFRADQDRDTTRQQIEDSMVGYSLESGGVWRILAGVWTTPVVALTDEDMVAPTAVVQTCNVGTARYNGAKGTYVNAHYGLPRPSEDFTPYQNKNFRDQDAREKNLDLVLPFTSSHVRTQQISRVLVEQSRGGFVLQIHPKMSAWWLQPGDRIVLSSLIYGFTNKTFRVQDWTYSPATPLALQVVEDEEAYYDLADEVRADASPNTNLPSPMIAPGAPLDLMVESGADLMVQQGSTLLVKTRVSWARTTSSYVRFGGTARVQYRLASRPDEWQTVDLPGDSVQADLMGLQVGGEYQVRVRFLTAYTSGNWSQVTHKVAGRALPPAEANGLSLAVEADGIYANWLAPTGLDLLEWALTQVRVGRTWAEGADYFNGKATSANLGWFPAGVVTVWVAHGNSLGQWGEPVSAQIEIIAPIQPVVSGSVAGYNVELSWTPSGQTQPLVHYEVRVGNIYAEAEIVGKTPALAFARTEPGTGTRLYWVTAVDAGGNRGPQGYKELTVLPGIDEALEELQGGFDELAQELQQETRARTEADAAETAKRQQEVAAEALARQQAVAGEATARGLAITAEQTARGQAIATETTNRTAAIQAEAAARGSAIAAEVTARNTAISTAAAQEVTARNAAIAVEATNRATAITAEQTARNAAIAVETTNRATAITGEQQARATAIAAEATARTAAITKEQGDRSAAIAVETAARGAALTAEATARGAAIAVEVTNRGTAIAAEATARGAAIAAEAALRASEDQKEANARIAAIAAEQGARTTAIAAEATARGAALLAETNARTAAVNTETTARQEADAALAGQITTLNSSVGSNAAALQQEAQTRANADGAEALARQGLAVAVLGSADIAGSLGTVAGPSLSARFLNAPAGAVWVKPTVDSLASGVLYEERQARVAADSAEVSARESLAVQLRGSNTGTDVNALTSGLIFNERVARVAADAAEVTARQNLATTVSNNKTSTDAALLAEQTARSTADAAEVTAREALAATVTGNKTSTDAAILAEQNVRATADTANASAITALSTTVSTNAGTSAAGLVAEAATRAAADSAEATQRQGLSVALTGVPDLSGDVTGVTGESLVLDFTADSYQQFVKPTGATLSSGLIFEERSARITADEAEVTARQALAATVNTNKTAAEALVTAEQLARTTADTAIAGTVTALSTTVTNNKTSTDAAITAEQQARSTADAAEITARESLATQLRGNATGTDVATLTSGLLFNERLARVAADDAEVTARQGLATTVANNRTAAEAAMTAEQAARSTADSAEVTARESLATQLRGNAAGTDIANVTSGLLFSERQARVAADSAEATARQALATTVTNNKTSTDAAIASEQTARSNADTALAGTVTALTTTVTGNKTAADAALTAEQTARSTADTALAGQITALTATVTGNAGGAAAGLLLEQNVRAAADAAEALQRQSLSTVLTGLADPAADLGSVAGPSLSARLLQAPAGAVWVKPSGPTLASGLIFDERTARITADAAEVTARQGLATTVNTNKTEIEAALLAEQTARSTADAAEVTARQNLATTVTNNKTAVDAALLAEQNARSTADAAEVTAREALTATVTGNKTSTDAAILAEQQARASGDAAEATARQALATTVTGNKTTTDAAIAAEALARSTADAAEVTARQALATTVTGNKTAADAAMLAEQNARSTADAAEVTAREALAATVLSNQGTATAAISAEAAARAAADAAEVTQRQGLSVALTGVPDLSGDVTGVTGESLILDFFNDDYQQFTKPTGALLSSGLLFEERAARITADEAEVTARQGLATTVSNNKTAADAALLAEQTARSTADTAEVTARENLQTQLRGTYAGTDVAQLSSGLIHSERQARVSGDAAEATARQALATTVTGNKTTTDAAIAAEATARSTADSAEVTARENLATQLRGNATGTDLAQLTSGLLFNERQARVTGDAAEATARQGLATTVSNNKTATDAAILAEQTARSTADASEVIARENLATQLRGNATGTDVDTLTSGLLFNERQARAAADAAEVTARQGLATTVSNNKTAAEAAMLAEQAARSAADSAEVTARETLATQIRGNSTGTDPNALTSGLLFNERVARVNADAAEATARQGLATTVSNNKTAAESAMTAEQTARSTGDATNAAAITALTSTVTGNAGAAAAGLTTEAATRAAADAAEALQRQTLSVAMTGMPDAAADLGGVVGPSLSARLLSAPAGAVWVKPTGATLSSGLIFEERDARITADAAEVTARQALAATVTGNKATTDAAIVAEQTARANADTAIAGTVTALTTTVTGNKTAADAAMLAEQNTRSTADTANANAITALTTTVTTDRGTAAAALTTEAAARAAADAAEVRQREGLSVALTGLPSASGDVASVEGESLLLDFTADSYQQFVKPTGATLSSGLIFEERAARITADEAEVTARQALAATVNTNKTQTDAAILAEQQARATALAAEATARQSLTTTVNSNKTAAENALAAESTARSTAITAAVATEASARSTAIAAEASARQALATTVGSHTASISTTSTALATLTGQVKSSWRLNVDANGKTSGIILDNDGSTASMILLVDKFAIAQPGPGNTTKYPFAVGQIAGVSSIGIDGNLFIDGTVKTRALEAEAVTADKIKAKAVTTAHLAAGSVTADKVDVGVGANLVPDSGFVAGGNGTLQRGGVDPSGWGWGGNMGPANTARGINSAGPEWTPTGGNTIVMHQPNASFSNQQTLLDQSYSPLFSVSPNERYEMSVYIGAHRCSAFAVLVFVDGNGNEVASVETPIVVTGTFPGGRSLSYFARVGAFLTAPNGATAARLILRKRPTLPGSADSYAFFTHPVVARATASQTVFSPYTPSGMGTRIAATGIDTPNLSAVSAVVGLLRTKDSGQRTEIDNNGVRIYGSNNVMRVRLGEW